MLTSPFAWMSAGKVKAGIVIAVVVAGMAGIVMTRVARPIARQGGANIPHNLMENDDPGIATTTVNELRVSAAGKGTDIAVTVFAIDFLFLAAVYLGLALGCDAVGRFWGGLPLVPRLAGSMAWLSLVGAVVDVVEDTAWLRMILHREFGLAPLAGWATRMKWVVVLVVTTFLLVSVALRIFRTRVRL